MTPLILLVLLAFFFVLALAFTLWAALTVGDYAKRAELGASARGERQGPRRADRRRAAKEPREPKPWERVPEPATRERRREPARGKAQAVQGTLWERPPAQAGPKPAGQPASQVARATPPPKAPVQAAEQPGGRVVVTPRKPDTDAFERFLESEKSRD